MVKWLSANARETTQFSHKKKFFVPVYFPFSLVFECFSDLVIIKIIEVFNSQSKTQFL